MHSPHTVICHIVTQQASHRKMFHMWAYSKFKPKKPASLQNRLRIPRKELPQSSKYQGHHPSSLQKGNKCCGCWVADETGFLQKSHDRCRRLIIGPERLPQKLFFFCLHIYNCTFLHPFFLHCTHTRAGPFIHAIKARGNS